MVVTGQASMFAWVAKQDADTRITAKPVVFVKHVGRTAADLLAQMLWWCDQVHNSEKRFYHSDKQWQEELYMTKHEVRASIEKLERAGAIRRKVARVPGHGEKTTWYEVVFDTILKWWNSAFPNTENQHLEIPKIGQSYIKEKNEEEEGKEEQALCAKSETADTGKGITEKDTNMAVRPSVKGKVSVDSTGLLKQLKATKAGKLVVPTGTQNSQALVSWWKSGVVEYNPSVSFVKEPTAAEYGMFKNFAKACNDHHKPPAEVLAATVKDWIGYVKFVQTRQGLGTVPTVPSIRFLLSYVQDAIEFWNRESQVAVTPVVQVIAPLPQVAKSPQPTTDNVATLEDILAIKKQLFGKT